MTRNFTALSKLRKIGDTAPLKVKCDWVADELFILFVDGNAAWRGQYSTKEIKTFCKGLGITKEEYIRKCQDAFSNKETNEKFSFAIENNMFIWKQEVDKDITVKFGGIKLSSVPLIETLHILLDFAFEMIECCQKDALDAKKKHQYFEEDRSNLVCKLKKCEEGKNEMENSLYCKFLSLLNTKKEKIRILEQELSDLSSKTQNNVNEREKQESEESDKTAEKIKHQPSIKKTRQPRNISKLQPVAQTSTAANTECHGLSQNPSECSDVSIIHSKGKELLIPKRTVRKKVQDNIKTNSNAENLKSICKKEKTEVNDEPFTVPELQHNDVKDSVLYNPNTISHKNNTGLEALNHSAGCSCFSSNTASECSKSAKNYVTTTTTDCTVINEKSKLKPVETSPFTLLTNFDKGTKSVHAGSQAKSNELSKIPDIICPIDIVSEKSSTQSCVKQNIKSMSNISDSKKKDQSSPGKLRKDFEIISPLDLLNSTTYSPPRKRSAVSSEPVNMSEKNCLNSALKPVCTQDYSASRLRENIKIDSEGFLGNLHDTDTVCEDPCNRTGTNEGTVYGIKLIESKNEMEANHYDSDTDVDEPEDSCRSPNSCNQESCQVGTSSSLKNAFDHEYGDTHQQKLMSISENLLNNSIDSDNFCMELHEPALPKRTRRSDRLKKCVPVDNKSINHFTRLSELREKNENIAQDVKAPIYDQDTQIVDTQKLLDEL